MTKLMVWVIMHLYNSIPEVYYKFILISIFLFFFFLYTALRIANLYRI